MSVAERAAPRAGAPLPAEFFARDPVEVARDLIGCTIDHAGAGGTIVETEAYREDDPASHSHRGPRGRAVVMFGPPGRLYVYRSYGLHWCANLVCGPEGAGAAVLLRAVRPERGLPAMRHRRGPVPDRLLAAGPGRLTQALGITGDLDGAPATGPHAAVRVGARAGRPAVTAGPRIGISRAVDVPWRFGLAGSPHLSRPFPEGAR